MIKENEKLKLGLGRVENIVGKGENAGSQQFLLFPQCFQEVSFLISLKVGIVRKRVNSPISVVVCRFFEFGAVSK